MAQTLKFIQKEEIKKQQSKDLIINIQSLHFNTRKYIREKGDG